MSFAYSVVNFDLKNRWGIEMLALGNDVGFSK